MIPLIISNTIANRQQLDDHFSFYKERFFQLQVENQFKTKSIGIVLAGKYIELRFVSEKLFDFFISSLRWAMECAKGVHTSSSERTIFYIWQDEILNYFPKDIDKSHIWQHESELANISVRPGESHMTAYDYNNKEAYFCIRPSETIDLAHTAHPFLPLFHLWALQNHLLFVHSAGIEIEGVGILISGLGGRGKSTTAVSALLNHCGFIGDDYVLLGSSGEKKGYPIYSNAFLNPDMVNQMEELKSWVISVDHTRNNKTLIDLMVKKNYFKEVITLDFIILPNVINIGLPSIEKVGPASALAEMTFSSANQNGERTNKVFMQQIFDAVKGLPVYQFNMSSDLHKNIKYLKKFTNEWRKKRMYKLNEEKMFFDMADNQAIVIDFTTGIYYAMNSLGSVVFEYLTKAVSTNSIEEALKKHPQCPQDIASQLSLFVDKLLEKELLLRCDDTIIETVIIPTGALVDGFVLELSYFDDAQDIMMADPMHDVEVDQGWPVLKPGDSNA